MLSTTAKTNICTILEALVHGGAVRPEDDSAVTQALAGIKAEFATDEAKIDDLGGRVAALEDLENGEEEALKGPAAAATEATVDSSVGAAGVDEITTASVAPQALT